MSSTGARERLRELFPQIGRDGPLTQALSQRERETGTNSAAPGAATPEAAVTDKPAGQSVDETTTDRVLAETVILPDHHHLPFVYPGTVVRRSRYTEGGLRICSVADSIRVGHGELCANKVLELNVAQAEWLASWLADFVNGNLRQRSGVECARCRQDGNIDEHGLGDRDCPDCGGEGTVNLIDVFEAKPRIVRMDDQPRRFIAGEDLEPLPRCLRTPVLPGVPA